MRTCYLYIRVFLLFCLSTIAVHAVQLSSASVLFVKGPASYGAHEEETNQVTEDTIFSEGDSIVTGDSGVVYLMFSNGVALTIEANSNLILTKLNQRPYWKSEESKIPKEEISKSMFALDLKYGSVKGNVKGLREDSEFRINTFLGDTVVSGNLFFVELLYHPFSKVYILNVQNMNGIVDLITKFSEPVNFGRKSTLKRNYDHRAKVFQIVRIPPKRTVSVKAPRSTPEFSHYYTRFPQNTKSRLVKEFQTIEPFLIDQEVTVVSPNGSGDMEPDIMVNKPMVGEIVPETVVEDIIPKTVVEEAESDLQ